MFPKGRVSPIQELQMTTVPDKNVHNLAISGTFDDCQVQATERPRTRDNLLTLQ